MEQNKWNENSENKQSSLCTWAGHYQRGNPCTRFYTLHFVLAQNCSGMNLNFELWTQFIDLIHECNDNFFQILKEDIYSSLWNRFELLCDELERLELDQGPFFLLGSWSVFLDSDANSLTPDVSKSTQQQQQKMLLEIPTKLSSECQWILPRRVFVNFKAPITVCDYLMPYETEEVQTIKSSNFIGMLRGFMFHSSFLFWLFVLMIEWRTVLNGSERCFLLRQQKTLWTL